MSGVYHLAMQQYRAVIIGPMITPGKSRRSRSRKPPATKIVSLLWPDGYMPPREPPPGAWEGDLGLGDLVQTMSSDRRYLPFIRKTLVTLTADPAVIAWRQAVFGDFLRNAALAERLGAILPRLSELRQGHALLGRQRRSLLLETADRLSELDLYVKVVQDLSAALQDADLQSAALRELWENLLAAINDESFRALCDELPPLQAPLQNLAGLTVGINLDTQLRPKSAVLLSINERPFAESASLLERLLGLRNGASDESGIAPLHHVPSDPDERPLSPLFQDLDRLITQIVQPVARALGRYVQFTSNPLAPLEHELAFFTAAVGLVRRFQERDITICQPELAPAEERVSQIADLVNVNLALRQEKPPIPSDLDFGPDGRIAILTGPNSGGKTTYLQAAGLAHALFQAGLPIPARQARISPVDSILTHFPALETRQLGRLAEEAERLREIFQRATNRSLVLLNESLSSTTPDEALYLAQDVVCGLRVIGVRALYATHLIELASRIADIEAAVEGDSRVISLVAGVQETPDNRVAPTFKITSGAPLGSSYAREIARRHGISLDQILAARTKPDPG